jgi:hypothetical protein
MQKRLRFRFQLTVRKLDLVIIQGKLVKVIRKVVARGGPDGNPKPGRLKQEGSKIP